MQIQNLTKFEIFETSNRATLSFKGTSQNENFKVKLPTVKI